MKSWLHVAALILFTVLSSFYLPAQSRTFLQTGLIVEDDFGADGTVDSRTFGTNLFDVRGRWVGTVDTGDLNGDGRLDYRSTSTLTRDNGNRILAEVDETDWDGDGTTDLRTTTTYDYTNPYEFREVTLGDGDANGSADYRTTTTYSYDHRHATEQIVYEFENNLNGIVDIRSTDYITNDYPNRLVIRVSDFDFDADGVIDASSKETFTLNSRREIISGFREDFDADGRVASTATTTYTYDGNRNLVQVRGDSLYAGPTGPTHDLFTITFFYTSRREFSGKDQGIDSAMAVPFSSFSPRGDLRSRRLPVHVVSPGTF